MANINMSLNKNPMPSQEANVRAHNFDEVALGYTEEVAIDEALRCLNCKNMPCVEGCPVKIHIPEFISKIKEGDFEGAYQVINKSSSLPAVCGRVCPQEVQCEEKCVRGIKGESVGIGRLERFVADWHNAHSDNTPEIKENNGHKVAVVGSGPSGLTCAGDLAKKGYDVTIYEALHTAGGVLVNCSFMKNHAETYGGAVLGAGFIHGGGGGGYAHGHLGVIGLQGHGGTAGHGDGRALGSCIRHGNGGQHQCKGQDECNELLHVTSSSV